MALRPNPRFGAGSEPDMHSRRDWILGSLGLVAWQDIASAQQHAHDSVKAGARARFEVLDAHTAAEITAIVAQIIPSDDGPGATEAGVVYFIDRALATFDADKHADYRKGMAAIEDKRNSMFPGPKSVATLPPASQINLIRVVEATDFFELLRTHTMMGFLGSPVYGGNQDKVGWKHIGFDDRMAFEPPFGYYDAEARKDGAK
jgi:gluconate 2-dehydrogenase gamma chain